MRRVHLNANQRTGAVVGARAGGIAIAADCGTEREAEELNGNLGGAVERDERPPLLDELFEFGQALHANPPGELGPLQHGAISSAPRARSLAGTDTVQDAVGALGGEHDGIIAVSQPATRYFLVTHRLEWDLVSIHYELCPARVHIGGPWL